MDNRFTQLLIIDINPGVDVVTKEIIEGKIGRGLKNASIYQYVVLMSHSNFMIAQKLANDIGIKFGYIICDNGARIYSIIKGEFIYQKPINLEALSAVVHHGIMLDTLVLASGENSEYGYTLELLDAAALNKKHYIPLSFTSEYDEFKKFFHVVPIYSVMYFTKNDTDIYKKMMILSLIKSDLQINIDYYFDNYLIITDKDNSKHKAILKVMEDANISNLNNIQYLALTSIDGSCLRAFNNHVVFKDLMVNSKDKKYIKRKISMEQFVEVISATNSLASKLDGNLIEFAKTLDDK